VDEKDLREVNKTSLFILVNYFRLSVVVRSGCRGRSAAGLLCSNMTMYFDYSI